MLELEDALLGLLHDPARRPTHGWLLGRHTKRARNKLALFGGFDALFLYGAWFCDGAASASPALALLGVRACRPRLVVCHA